MNLSDLQKKKIAILGMGANNKGLAAFFRNQNIDFDTITWNETSELNEKIKDYDIVFRTPGLPVLSEPLQKYIKTGGEVYSQTKLFFDLCPGFIIGVTGTKGKGTTSTLIFQLLQAFGKQVFLAGNIGQDPFEFFSELSQDSIVVLELSSFQLQDLHKSPNLAVVLNITSEHLDYHADNTEYVTAKQNIVTHQSQQDLVVLNYDYHLVRSFVDLTPAKVFWNSTQREVNPGAFIEKDQLVVMYDEIKEEVLNIGEVGLPGFFNLENITAAVSATLALGLSDVSVIAETIRGFKGLEHRLEFVAQSQGVKYFNDSFSTTPETAIAAITAFSEPIILIIGGSEKNSDYSVLAQKIADSQIKALIPIGLTGPKIAELSRKAGYQGKILDNNYENMQKIVDSASQLATDGDVVLLSPASASFDMFENYKDRGLQFKQAVKSL